MARRSMEDRLRVHHNYTVFTTPPPAPHFLPFHSSKQPPPAARRALALRQRCRHRSEGHRVAVAVVARLASVRE
eukprot:scaffold29861_cov101-Isochrysis_galbana.AAC.1